MSEKSNRDHEADDANDPPLSRADTSPVKKHATKSEREKLAQSSLFVELTPEEEKVVHLLKEHGELFIDQISGELELPTSRISTLLLNLEFKNVLVTMPGQMYKLK
mgnify:CR=1 FL=1